MFSDKKLNHIGSVCNCVEELSSIAIEDSVVYICSKYSGNIRHNTVTAREYCRLAVNLGVVPIAPHLLFPQFMSDDTERKRAIEMDKLLLKKCDQIWVFIDESGGISKGMRAEIEEAKKLNIPVFCVLSKENIERSKSLYEESLPKTEPVQEELLLNWHPVGPAQMLLRPEPYELVLIRLESFPGGNEDVWIAYMDSSGNWFGEASDKRITRRITAWSSLQCLESFPYEDDSNEK